MIAIRRATPKDKKWLEEFLNENWGADFIVSRGKCHYPSKHEALIAEDDGRRIGLLTFREENQEIEILSLDAVLPQRGACAAFGSSRPTTISTPYASTSAAGSIWRRSIAELLSMRES